MENNLLIAYAEKYKDTIFRIALNYFGNIHDSEDAVQEVFMKLFKKEEGFKSEEHAKHWIIRVTINYCKNILKSSWFKKNITSEEINIAFPVMEEEEVELLSLVMSLKEKYRVVIYLFYYECLSVKEIGEYLNIKESLVTTRLARGRKQLKLELMEDLKNEKEPRLIY